jgi:hypothetical protein
VFHSPGIGAPAQVVIVTSVQLVDERGVTVRGGSGRTVLGIGEATPHLDVEREALELADRGAAALRGRAAEALGGEGAVARIPATPRAKARPVASGKGKRR